MIVVIDIGMGNVNSIKNMYRHLGVEVEVTGDINAIESANKLILPGVGAFDEAMKRLRFTGILEVVEHRVKKDSVPVLGICLGMQILFNSSEEGSEVGMGLLEGTVRKLQAVGRLKVPHMGWNTVQAGTDSKLTFNFNEETRFYFVHSFYVQPKHEADVIMTCEYGIRFAAAVRHKNIYGVQFHPEKSHRFGMELLNNFSSIKC